MNPAAAMVDHVCGVMVTYGNRKKLLERALAAAEGCGVRRFVIVGNGVEETYGHMLQGLEGRQDTKCHIVHLQQNGGSAVGFRRGIEAALEIPEVKFLWFLDDDNAPDQNALSILLARYRQLLEEHATDRLALLSLRTDRSVFVRIAKGATPACLFPPPYAIVGFDLGKFVARQIRRLCQNIGITVEKRRTTCGPKKVVEVPYGPYSGLFLHRDLIGRIGLPNPDFILYGDDDDFTSRIAVTGGKLFLVPESTIDDIEVSWHVARGSGRMVDSLLHGGPDFRIFYSVRNGAYVASRKRTAHVRFMINRSAFMTYLWLLALWYGRLDRYRLIQLALRDGLEGKLGKKAGFDLP